MKKEITLAELFKELEKKANEAKESGKFKGDNKDLACVLFAGLEMLTERK